MRGAISAPPYAFLAACTGETFYLHLSVVLYIIMSQYQKSAKVLLEFTKGEKRYIDIFTCVL
jgi:hypothetical protein